VRLRQALGTADAEPVEAAGAGSFDGRWTGTLDRPVFEGRFRADPFAYLGVVWGSASWRGALSPTELRSDALVLKRPGGDLSLEGTMQTGALGEDDALDVRVRFAEWPAADLARALEWDLPVEGVLSGRAHVEGRRSDPRGDVQLTAREGRYAGVPFADLQLESALRGGVTEVTRGRARLAGGMLRFAGTLTDDGIYDGEATLADADAAALLRPMRGLSWSGRLFAEAVMQGALARPRLQARLFSPRLSLGTEEVGGFEARLHGEGDGRIAVQARSDGPALDGEVAGSVGAAAPWPADLTVRLDQGRLSPLLHAALGQRPSTVEVVIAGQGKVEGPLEDPRALTADATLSEVRVEIPEYPVRNREPIRLAYRDGAVEVKQAHLAAEGTDLLLAGRAGIATAASAVALRLSGSADLRALSLLAPELRGRGGARVTMDVTGTRDEPQLAGQLEILGASVRARGFPHGVEDVRGRVEFTEGLAHWSEVTGTVGGGPVELSGQAAYARGRLASFDVRAVARGAALRYPEGLRSVVDADLRLFGDLARQWLTGKVDVRHAAWTERYDLASELLAEARPAEEPAAMDEGLRYDIRVSAPGTLKVDNNLASLTARAELNVQGTYGAPVVLGRAEVDGGRVYFQGNTYVIRRGSLDFANPRRIDPFFDIEAETRIRSYRVTLKMNGTLERVYPTLSSDPPLSTVAILGLLAGADESKIAELETRRDDNVQRNLAAAGAATLAAGVISEEMGLERGAARLGLDRFSIDPSIIRGDVTNPTARLTLGKRITPDVSILYSVDLRGTEERLVSVEYTLSDRLSVLLTSVQPGGFGFDLRLRQSR
jgi:autotransporter translocation and assembly factor TamB